MQKPASRILLKDILFTLTESHDRSRLNRPFASWPDAEVAAILMAAIAPARLPRQGGAVQPGPHRVGQQDSRRLRDGRRPATTWEELPDGTFADQCTNVRAALMTVQR
jgi:hypothetical protein